METKKKVHGDKVTRDKGENDDCQGKDAWSAARHIFIKGDRVKTGILVSHYSH